MNLLSPDEVKKEKTESAMETRQRTNALSAEESRISKELNLVRSNAEAEKKKIAQMTDEYVAEQEARRDTIKREVENLEVRRGEALKPVDELLKAAKVKTKEANDLMAEAKKAEANAVTLLEDARDKAEGLVDKEDELNEREAKLDGREAKIKQDEARQSVSRGDLAAKWLEYHEAVHKANKAQGERESRLNATEVAQEARQKAQDKRQDEQNTADRALKDKYVALEQAKIHLGIK